MYAAYSPWNKLVSLDPSSTYTSTSFPKNPVPLEVGTTLLCGSRSSHFHQSAESALLVQYGEERGPVGEAGSQEPVILLTSRV